MPIEHTRRAACDGRACARFPPLRRPQRRSLHISPIVFEYDSCGCAAHSPRVLGRASHGIRAFVLKARLGTRVGSYGTDMSRSVKCRLTCILPLRCPNPTFQDHRRAWRSTSAVSSLLENMGFKFATPTSDPSVGSLRGCLLTCSNDECCHLGNIPGNWPCIMSASCEVWEVGNIASAQEIVERYVSEPPQIDYLPAIWSNLVLWHGACWPSVSARQMNQWLLHKLEADWAHAAGHNVQLGFVLTDFMKPALAQALVMSNTRLFASHAAPAAIDTR